MILFYLINIYCWHLVDNNDDKNDPYMLVCMDPIGMDCSFIVDKIRWYLDVNAQEAIYDKLLLKSLISLTLRLQNRTGQFLYTFTSNYGVGNRHVVQAGCPVKT